MTFKRNKYKILHLGFKKITYVSTALKSSGEKKKWGFQLATGLMSQQCDTASKNAYVT